MMASALLLIKSVWSPSEVICTLGATNAIAVRSLDRAFQARCILKIQLAKFYTTACLLLFKTSCVCMVRASWPVQLAFAWPVAATIRAATASVDISIPNDTCADAIQLIKGWCYTG